MPLYTYTIDQSEAWDKVVRSFSSYDVYYLSGYVKAFQIHGDGDPVLFYYDGEKSRGINVVMKRDIADDVFFADKIGRDVFYDFVTPYGYSGWLIEGDSKNTELFIEYEEWCKDHNIVCEFVRYHPMLDNALKTDGFYDVTVLGNTVAIDLSSTDIIWNNLTSKNRNMVRKAQKSGVTIYHGNSSEMYETFKKIYTETMDYDKAAAYYYFENDFYNSIRDNLPNESQIFCAEVGGKTIANSIIIFANGYMNYHLSGSIKEYQNLAPSNLLLYEAALWGCKNGFRSLHLGGGVGSREDSLYKFKKSFNRNESREFAIGKKIYLYDVYEKLTLMKKPDSEGGFFPKYRE